MKITILTLTGKEHKLYISKETTLKEIMKLIQKCEGVPIKQQVLIFKGELLNTHEDLIDGEIAVKYKSL